jgi:hypothetical protein
MTIDDDFYSLLGVEHDAPTGDIRSAYRDKKAALGEKGDKTETARLNKAWNVLSDPYQRGRYDEQRMRAAAGGDGDGDGDGVEVSANGSGGGALEKTTVGAQAEAPVRRRLFEPRPRRAGKEMPPPSIDLPAGTAFAPQRSRIIAMVIDVFVMIVLLFGVQAVVGDRLVARWYPQEHAQLTAITDDPPGKAKSEIDTLKDKADASDKKADQAEKDNAGNAASLRKTADADKKAFDDKNDEIAHLSKKVAPAGIVVLEGIMLACLVYLVVPSALIGQTLGKRIQKLRVIRLDGSPLGWSGALIRYGLIILATNAMLLFPILGVIGIAIVFFFVLGWMRNPNHMGLQDRVAKTIVVEA